MRVLVAIDGSESSEAAVRVLTRQMRPDTTEVYVLHVVEPAFTMSDAALAEIERRSGQIVGDAATLLRDKGFKVTTGVEDGDARSRIIDVADAWKAELIVVASHGRKGLDRFLMGSVSEAVARHAHCSVQIVRSQPESA